MHLLGELVRERIKSLIGLLIIEDKLLLGVASPLRLVIHHRLQLVFEGSSCNLSILVFGIGWGNIKNFRLVFQQKSNLLDLLNAALLENGVFYSFLLLKLLTIELLHGLTTSIVCFNVFVIKPIESQCCPCIDDRGVVTILDHSIQELVS